MKNIKRTLASAFLAIFGAFLLVNCEPEIDSLGEQLFQDDATQGKEAKYDVIAKNLFLK